LDQASEGNLLFLGKACSQVRSLEREREMLRQCVDTPGYQKFPCSSQRGLSINKHTDSKSK